MNENNNNTASRLMAKRHNVYCGNFPSRHNRLGDGSRRQNPSLTPVNTGKVLIGSAYQPQQRNTYSADQEWLQGALLKPSTPDHPELSQTVLWWLYAAALLVVAITF